MADKIATRQDINNLKSEAFSSELNRCPTYSEIMALGGLSIDGSWSENQLVTLPSISVTSPIQVTRTPISYPFIFNNDTYALNSSFSATGIIYNDLIFPIGYVVFNWSGFEEDSNPGSVDWEHNNSNLDWINNSKLLLFPSSAIGKAIESTAPGGINADLQGTSVNSSLSIEFESSFLNRLPSDNNMIVYIFNSGTIPSDKYIGQIIYKNANDNELLDANYPLYKWSPDVNTVKTPPYAYTATDSTDIATSIRFTANEITDYVPSNGSVYTISSDNTDVRLMFPVAKAEDYVGGYYTPINGYLKTGLKAIDLSTLTGNLNCKVTINVDSKFGSNVRIGAYINAESSTGTDFIIGTGDSEINQLALVETGKDVTFAYTINMADSTSPSGYHFSGITYFVYSVDGEQTIISDSTTISKLLNSFLPGLGYTGEKALEMIENNQFLKYLHKNIKITITDVETFTVEII